MSITKLSTWRTTLGIGVVLSLLTIVGCATTPTSSIGTDGTSTAIENDTLLAATTAKVESIDTSKDQKLSATTPTQTKTTDQRKPTTDTPTKPTTPQNDLYTVTKVVDGDTIDVTKDGKTLRVRYIGMDTPETVHPSKGVQCFGKDASSKNKELILGKQVRLEKDVSETDRYGRFLRYVYLGDTFINLELVKQGYATAATFPPDVKHSQDFVAAEREAREAKRGLWASCKSTEATSSPKTTTTNQPTASNPTPAPTPTSPTPNGCTIKGNISTRKEKIYHLPGCGSYTKTSIDESAGERWFCTEQQAVQAGWRKAENC